jgi:hypothetical protein
MKKPTIRKAAEGKQPDQATILLKLTDVQRAVLSGAVQRDDGAAMLPERMTEKGAQKLAATLITKGLVREVRAKAEMPVWRRNEAGRALALVVAKLGREAIKGDGDRQKDDAAAAAPPPFASAEPSQITESSRSGRAPRQGSKLAEVMTLLGRKQGVSIKEVTSVTGWLPHTTRAALTGLRKRGYRIIPYEPPAGADKIMRLHTQTAVFESHRVLLPKEAPWLAEYISELTGFPGSRYADQVDSTTQALDYLQNIHGRENWMDDMDWDAVLANARKPGPRTRRY